MAVAGVGAELWSKSEPEPKINNFGSATLLDIPSALLAIWIIGYELACNKS